MNPCPLTAPEDQEVVQDALLAAGLVRVTWRDDSLPHQIRLTVIDGNQIGVSCNCRDEPLEVRSRWEGGEAIGVWRQHMADVGREAV